MQLLERMIKRDDAQADTLAHVTSRMGSLAAAMEGQQTQLDRLIRLQEGQTEHNVRMVALIERSAEHGRTFERFGEDIAHLKRESAESLRAHASAKGSVRMLAWVIGTTLPIGILLVGFAYNTLAKRLDDLKVTHTEDKAEAATARAAIISDLRDLRTKQEERRE